MPFLKPFEYIYYRTYSFLQKNNIPFAVHASVKATAITVYILCFGLLTLYMLLSIKGIINDNGISILILGICAALSIFFLDRYFERRYPIFEGRWKHQNRILRTFLGYFIAFIAITLFIFYCYLADINRDLNNQ